MHYTKYFILLINIYSTTYINLDRCNKKEFPKIFNSEIRKLHIELSPKTYKSDKMKDFLNFASKIKPKFEFLTMIYDTKTLTSEEKKNFEHQINFSTQQMQRICSISVVNYKEKKHNNIPTETDLLGKYEPDKKFSPSSLSVDTSSLLTEHDIKFDISKQEESILTQASFTENENLDSEISRESKMKYEEITEEEELKIPNLQNVYPISLKFNHQQNTSTMSTQYLDIRSQISIVKQFLHIIGIYHPFIVKTPQKEKYDKLIINDQGKMTPHDFKAISHNKNMQKYYDCDILEIHTPDAYDDEATMCKILETSNKHRQKENITINTNNIYLVMNLFHEMQKRKASFNKLSFNIQYKKDNIDTLDLVLTFIDTAYTDKIMKKCDVNFIGNITKEQEQSKISTFQWLSKKHTY